jgi:hypothetical protein
MGLEIVIWDRMARKDILRRWHLSKDLKGIPMAYE